ncbi:hypothetical protein F4777DRAFT_579934 [Nemania sp. FL0916]|nr:hypothetical protein F4777DRAFT_579934 [Nemania sp. FL0916]
MSRYPDMPWPNRNGYNNFSYPELPDARQHPHVAQGIIYPSAAALAPMSSPCLVHANRSTATLSATLAATEARTISRTATPTALGASSTPTPTPMLEPATIAPGSCTLAGLNPMADLRDAEKTVAEFARLIEHLRPVDENASHATHIAAGRPALAARNSSTGSQEGTKAAIRARWRSWNSKKDWDETVEGILWNELEQSQSRVAHKFKIDQTALKEYISCPDMMGLGSEFARHYHGDPVREKAYWAAEDLFFDLQAVKQGDVHARRWVDAKVYKKEWDLADHLIRFVLLAEQCRLCSGQEKWIAWQWNFAVSICFYLSVLRCYTVRDARQRRLAGANSVAGPSRHSNGSVNRISGHFQASDTASGKRD